MKNIPVTNPLAQHTITLHHIILSDHRTVTLYHFILSPLAQRTITLHLIILSAHRIVMLYILYCDISYCNVTLHHIILSDHRTVTLYHFILFPLINIVIIIIIIIPNSVIHSNINKLYIYIFI